MDIRFSDEQRGVGVGVGVGVGEKTRRGWWVGDATKPGYSCKGCGKLYFKELFIRISLIINCDVNGAFSGLVA
jgi:hypothetical protein